MAFNDYFVSVARGDDSTGDGTAAAPWKTIAKALGAGTTVSLGTDGARVWIEPGTYYEAVTLGLVPSESTPLEVVGDCDGAGFLAGGHASPRTGIVEWAAWDGDSAPKAASCLAYIGTRPFVTLRRIKFQGGNAAASCVRVDASAGWSLIDCAFVGYATANYAVQLINARAGPGLLVDRCDFWAGAYGIHASFSDADAGADPVLTVRNSRFRGGRNNSRAIWFQHGGSGGQVIRHAVVEHCSFLGLYWGVSFGDGQATLPATPSSVRGCLFLFCERGAWAGAAGQAVEDYNVFHGNNDRANITAGPNSSTTLRPAIDMEDGRLLGVPLRPFGEPTPGSPLGGFVVGSTLTADLYGLPRPAGHGSVNAAVGALERHDSGVKDETYADGGSGGCLKLVGPASTDRPVLVSDDPVTIAVKVRWDGDHGDAAKPKVELLAEPEIGVAGQVLTAVSAGGSGSTPNAYETLTFAPFTPTKPGVVMLRLISRAGAGSGACYFDSITIS